MWTACALGMTVLAAGDLRLIRVARCWNRRLFEASRSAGSGLAAAMPRQRRGKLAAPVTSLAYRQRDAFAPSLQG